MTSRWATADAVAVAAQGDPAAAAAGGAAVDAAVATSSGWAEAEAVQFHLLFQPAPASA